MAAAGMLLITSCASDEPAISNDGGVKFTLRLPANLTTRASQQFADGRDAVNLTYAVYKSGTDNLVMSKTIDNFFDGTSLENTLSIDLLNGETYDIVFWADAGTDAYTFDVTNASVSVNYENITSNSEKFDAFYTAENEFKVTGPIQKTITLYRPFAQINFGTSDLYYQAVTKEFGTDLADLNTTISLGNLPNTLDLRTRTVSGSDTYEKQCGVPEAAQNFPTIPNDTTAYKYLSMNYVLAAPETEIYDITFTVLNNSTKKVFNTLNVAAAPLQANHRTNIFGKLLTSTNEFNIVIDPIFDEPDYNIGQWDGKAVEPIINEATKSANINTPQELAGLASLVAKGNNYEGYTFNLNCDVDLNNIPWTPIATGTSPQEKAFTQAPWGAEFEGTPFAGTFDGQGHTIKGINLKAETNADGVSGLFAGVSGTVKNINVEDLNITETGTWSCGGVVGVLLDGGTVENVNVLSGSIQGYRGVGAVVGRIISNGTVNNCSNAATIKGTYDVGGIVGHANNTATGEKMLISNCVNTGKITANGYTGGIVGTSSAFIENCVNKADIQATSLTSVGGIVGEQDNYGDVTGCTNYGNVSNNNPGYGCGGIIGWMRYYGNSQSYPVKAVMTVSGNTNYGAISGGNDAGGIVGTCYNFGQIKENYNYAPSLSARTFGGGIVGNIQFDNTFPGMNAADRHVYVTNNFSSTTLENITANLKAEFAYINTPNLTTVEDNEMVDPKTPNE